MKRLEQLIVDYKPSVECQNTLQTVSFMAIAGIAAASRNTVINRLKESGNYYGIVSHTTRLPRSNNGIAEQDGVDYYFSTVEQIEQMVLSQELVEVKYVHDRIYGTTVDEFKKAAAANACAIADVDVQGVAEYIKLKPETHAVFLLPPSATIWWQRLGSRGQMSGDDLRARLISAKLELETALANDYFIVIINDQIDETVRRVVGVQTGEIDHTSHFAREIADQLHEFIDDSLEQP